MAIKDSYPAIRPSLDLNFAGSRMVGPRVTFTRASSATYFDEKMVMRTALAGVPRIDHDPVTGECKGLLIEEQRTNLLTYSEQFDNLAWTKNDATVSANATNAPDGTLTADKLVENTALTTHKVQQVKTKAASATQYTATIYVKPAGRTKCILYVAGTAAEGNSCSSTFDLSAVTAITNSVAGTFTFQSSSISEAGNGWYRLSVTGTSDTGTSIYLTLRLRGETSTSYTGDGTSGLYIWGAQLEQGAIHTSYIPTTSAQATRALDNAVMTDTNFSDWYRQDEGSLFAEFGPYANSGTGKNPGIAQLDDQTTNNIIRHFAGSSLSPVFGVQAGGVTQAYIESGTITPSVVSKTAGAYKTDGIAMSFNGAAVGTDVSAVVPTVNRLLIGSGSSGVSELNGYIRRIAYYPKRLTNEQLQALTA